MPTVTHTYAVLELTSPAFCEIRRKLEEAGYEDQFFEVDGRVHISMQGIAVTAKKSKA